MKKKKGKEEKKDKEENNKEEKTENRKEKIEDKEEKSIVGSFLGGIPMFGDFFKELGKTEVFKERFKEVDEQIKENLKKGEKNKVGFESNLFVRPLINEIKKESTEIMVEDDYFYGKKGKKLTLAVKVPKKEINWLIKGKHLFITADNFEKKIELPDYYKKIKKKQYKKGILLLELTK